MVAQLSFRRCKLETLLLHLFLVAAVLAGQMSPLFTPPAFAAPPAGPLQTIGDFLSLGANTARELQNAIQQASGETRAILEELNGNLNTLISTLSQTYRDNLYVTLDSLDAVTHSKLLELKGLMDEINEQLQQDIQLASQEAQNVIRRASVEIRRATFELEQSIKNTIIVAGETGVYVIDRAVYDGILFASLILLGLGLLLFIWLLFSRRAPSGWARYATIAFMAAYLALFGAMALIPPVRAFAMTFTGVGLEKRLEVVKPQPRILDTFPDTVILGKTKELEIWGTTLFPESHAPSVKISGTPVPVNASDDKRVVVNVSTLNVPDGSRDVVLAYDGRDGPREVVKFFRLTPTPAPPDLIITSYTVDPPSPIARGNTRATITVRNQGSGPVNKSFVLRWIPGTAISAKDRQVASLGAGESQTFTFDYSYLTPGRVDAVATIDPNDSVKETNEGNNSLTRSFNVQPAPQRRARVGVTFTQITVHDDADPAAGGEIWLNFNISGQTGRWPDSGTKGVNSGSTLNINKRFEVTLSEGESLTIYVNGTDEDNPGFPLFDDHDPLGTVNRSYNTGQEWGKGSHSERSTCPDGCYTIHYTIDVTWLQ